MKSFGVRLLAVLLAVLFAVGMLPAVTLHAAQQKSENAITSVAVQNDKEGRELCITVTLTDNTLADLKNTTLQVFALRTANQTSSIPYMQPVAFFRPQERQSQITVSCKDDPTLLYSYFVVCRLNADGSHQLLTDLHGLDNPQALADPENHAPVLRTKKGLNAPTPSDLFSCGASATVVQVALNEYFTSDPEAEDIFPLTDGSVFYARRSAFALLDHRIKMLRDGGVVVYLQLVLTAPTSSMGDGMDCLYLADVSESASYYAFGAQSVEAGNCLIDLFNFLAYRYGTDADGAQCVNWIIGDRVNAGTPFHYSGKTELTAFCEEYASALRLADICLRSACGEGRVYVPVSNRYDVESSSEQMQFGAAAFLTELSAVIRKTGDFPWQIAADLTPSETSSGDIRQDPAITLDAHSPYLTPVNFSLLSDLLSADNMTYNGASRSVLVYRFTLPGAYGNADAEGMQAANFVYAYAALNRFSCVECVVYSAYANNDSVGGIGGLCDGSNAELGAPKAILEVFRAIDTDRAGERCGSVLSYLNLRGWSELLPDFSPAELSRRKWIQSSGYTATEQSAGDVLWSFDRDLCGFLPSENATLAELREDESGQTFLFAQLYATDRPAYMGISRAFPEGWSVKSLRTMTLDFCVIAPDGVQNAEVLLRITGQGKTPVTYEGSALVSCGAWQSVSFDLSELRASLDTVSDVRILVRPADETYVSGDYCLLLDSVSAQTSASSRVWVAVLYVLSAILFLLAAFYIFVLVCNIRNARRRKKAALRRRPMR